MIKNVNSIVILNKSKSTRRREQVQIVEETELHIGFRDHR